MAKTLEDLQALLNDHGYAPRRLFDVVVATTVATKIYKNTLGQNLLEILLTIDRPNSCVVVEILRAFDLRAAKHKEATLACLMAATGRAPLLRSALDPTDGEIRLRVDCPCDAEGARDQDVLRALAVLPSFADAWYPQMSSAMEDGRFDASQVAPIDLSKVVRDTKPAPPTEGGDPNAGRGDRTEGDETDVTDRDSASLMQAAKISMKPGAHHNRLRALFHFRRWLDEHGRGSCDQN